MELRQYITIFRRWWWLLILATLVAGGIAYAVSQQQTPVYQATTTIIVGQSIKATDLDSNDILTSERLARTYADIARRQPVLQAVVDQLSLGGTWEMLRERVKVKPVLNTQLLEITVEAGSPEEARVTADELAHQLILLSPTSLENQAKDENHHFVRQQLGNLQIKIDAGNARLKDLETAMAGSLSADQVRELQTEINELEKLVTDWENNYTQLLVFAVGTKSPNYLAIVEPAQGAADPVRPLILLNAALSSLVGLLLVLGIVVLVERLDDTIKSTDDFSHLAVTSLGSIGHIHGKDGTAKLIAARDPFAPVTEAYRMVRSNIQFISVDRPVRSILVTSSTPMEGKSLTTANLGVVMAQAGYNTIIVDADLRRPTQHEIFQVPNLNGLTELLRSPGTDLKNYLRPTIINDLQVLPSGVLPPNPAELLGSKRMGQVVADLAELAHVVIYDSSPVLAVTDAAVLSNRVDGVVLITRAGWTRLGVVRQAVTTLKQAGATVFGAVLNRAATKKGEYSHYYHHVYRPSNRKLSELFKPNKVSVQK